MSDPTDSVQKDARRSFGAGIKRKRINFVRAGSEAVPTQTISHSNVSAGDRYLSIVFKNGGSAKEVHTTEDTASCKPSERYTQQASAAKGTLCEICKIPMSEQCDKAVTSSAPHEATIAHMVCMKHSHPPSHLDRNRQGLKYLSSYGWDPDSRLGLGAAGEGIRAPVKARVKHDTVGLGLKLGSIEQIKGKKVESLDARQARKKDLEDRKKRERLQDIFYRSDDVEKYLGHG